MQPITVGDCTSRPGEMVFGKLPIKNSELSLDIVIVQGANEGPTGFITGGMHGDEINGPRLVELAMQSLKPEDLKGILIFIPIANKTGFNKKTRLVPENEYDLNRSFAPEGGEGLSYDIAATIAEEVISKCSFGVDCHDAGGETVLFPQTRVHVDESNTCSDGCTVDIGKLFGTKIVLQREGIDGMMAIETYKHMKIPVLTVEIGGGLMLWEGLLQVGVKGVNNVLIHFGMLDGEIELPENQTLVTDTHRLRHAAQSAGLLHKKVSLGDSVHTGDTIATISDPSTLRSKTVESDSCGLVFSIKAQDKVNEGEEIASILQTETCEIHKTKPLESVQKL